MSDDNCGGLRVTLAFYRLTVLSPGRLLPWLGPALKGITAQGFKQRTCRWSHALQQTQWRYCRGCPHQQECGYGVVFEPDPPLDASVMPTARDGQRAIALAPVFPAVSHVDRGDVLDLRILLLGQAAAAHEAELLRTLQDLGPRGLLGRDRIAFAVAPCSEAGHTVTRDITATNLVSELSESESPITRLVVRLESPLFLRKDDNGHKLPLPQPSLADLFRASLRTLGRAFEVFGPGRLQQVDYVRLKQTAEPVACTQAHWQTFSQPHQSGRTGHRWDYRGVTGWAEFADVPRGLLPWLIFGGAVGAGQERLCGAGRWTVACERSEVQAEN